MGKATIGVIGGYWPENVFRYVAVPGWPLEQGLVERPARLHAAQPALISGSQVLTYEQLSREVERIAAALQQAVAPGGRVAVWAAEPSSVFTALLGAAKAGHAVCLLEAGATAAAVEPRVAEFGATLIVCDRGTETSARAISGTPAVVAALEELQSTRARFKKPRVDIMAPSVGLPDVAGLAHHSQQSLLAGALSWSTFLGLGPGQTVYCHSAPHRWEAFHTALAALFKGALCVFPEPGAPPPSLLEEHPPTYAVFSGEVPDWAGAYRRRSGRAAETLAGAFVSVQGSFDRTWRRRARNMLQTEVLTCYGSIHYGPVIASHPSWYEDSAVGIPVTNVDLWPLEPATKDALDVSWEAIEYAEIGFRSPMVAASALREGVPWIATGLVATTDPNGFYYLLERPSQWLRSIGLALPLVDY